MSTQPLKVKCGLCDVDICTGSASKRCPNLRVHIQSRTHQMKITMKDGADPIGVVYEEINKNYPGRFLRKGNHALCRDDHHKFNMAPAAGDVFARIVDHLKSSKHKKAAKKGRASESKTITTFFKSNESS